MRKQKKAAPVWHRFNGRLYKFNDVEDMKRFQIQLANNKVEAETNPVCGEIVNEIEAPAPLKSDGQDPS